MNKKDLKIEYLKGRGPGGQRKNKVETACRITHVPTGVQAYADERSQRHSRRAAMADLETRLRQLQLARDAAEKKARRDRAIRETETIRTYDFKSSTVKDHRTGKVASIKNVLVKGLLDLLR